MGSLFGKSKKPQASRITQQDRAILQLKQQRDRLKQYQKRIELSLENDRNMAKKCLQNGRKDRAKLLLRKKKYQETLLANTDQQLANMEKMAMDLEFAQIEVKVLDGLKEGNEALKKVHAMLDINEVERILDETREGVEKQQEIDDILSDMLTQQDEDDVMDELNALEAEENALTAGQLPDVPTDLSPLAEEEVEEEATPVPTKSEKVRAKKIALEA